MLSLLSVIIGCLTATVRLTGGDHSNGILQVSVGGYYRTVCGTGFDDVDAAVACRDLGFENGRKLPAGDDLTCVFTFPQTDHCRSE